MQCSKLLSRVALTASGLGLLATGAIGQEVDLRRTAVKGPADPGIVTTQGPSISPRGAEVCNGLPVTFTATFLRSELVGIFNVRTALIRAENFTTAAGGDLSLTTVTWWGAYSNDVPSADESFRVRVLGDDGAGAPDVNNVMVHEVGIHGANLTRTNTGEVVGGLTLYRYDLTLAGGATLAPSTCHWVEIAQEDVGDANQWLWATDNEDSRYHRTDLDGQYGPFSAFLSDGFDPAVCLDVDLTDNLCAAVVSDDPCVQDITTPDVTCQGPENAGTISFSGFDDFQIADDFRVQGEGTFALTELCWRGAYAIPGSPFINFAPAPIDNFSIAIYENQDGSPGPVIDVLEQGIDFTLERGYDMIAGTHEFAATISTPVMVNGGECYWISIINDVGDIRWGWNPALSGNFANHRSDPASSAGWPDVYSLTTRFENGDFSFCTSVELVPDGGCEHPCLTLPPPANDDCFSAMPLSVDGATAIGTNLCATRNPFSAEPCGFVNLGFVDVYYMVTNSAATDMDLTVTTDLPGTIIDSRISVYCAAGGLGCGEELSCVGSNDDAGAGLASTVTWTAAAGETYYIRVDGYDVGEFEIGVTSAVASGAAAGCENCEIEDLPDPLPSNVVVETEACGDAANDFGIGFAEVGPDINGGVWRGTAYADANDRDFDYFSLTIAEDTDLQLTWRSEFPLLYNLLDSTGTFVGGFYIAASCEGVVTTHIELAPGTYYIIYIHAGGTVSTTNNFYGAPCGTHDEVEVTLQDLRGACCLPDNTCVMALSDEECQIVQGGTYQGLGVDCESAPCGGAPACACETDGNDAQVDVFDLLAYLDLWFASDAGADLDGVAGVDVFDLLFFLDCWFPASAGNPCP